MPSGSARRSIIPHPKNWLAMDKTVSVAYANRRFSELLRTVQKGQSVVVTSHGKPVARITPVTANDRAADGARSALFSRLRKERVVKSGGWTRDDLYDDPRLLQRRR
jgi:prevent-host-death family protein